MIKFNEVEKNNPNYNTVLMNNKVYENKHSFISSLSSEDEDEISHISHCLVSIEPFNLPEATYLFGGKIKSVITNKIIFSKALISKEDSSKYTRGDSILEVLISDESLTDTLLSMGGNPSPCTISSVLGNNKNYNHKNNNKNSFEKAYSELDENKEYAEKKIKEIEETIKLSLKKGTFSKKSTEKIKVGLESLSSKLSGDMSYSINSLEENIIKDLTSVEIEIISTARKLMEIQKLGGQVFLENKTDVNVDNYFEWFLKGGFNNKEKETLIELYSSLLNSKNINDKLRGRLIELVKGWKSISRENPTNLSDGTFEINHVYGGIKMFGQLKESKKVVQLKIGQGSYCHEKNQCFTIRNAATFLISKEDLMNLIRGNTLNKQFPVTTTAISGLQVPFIPVHKTEGLSRIEGIEKKNLKIIENLKTLENELVTLIQPKVKSADKERIMIKLKEFLDELDIVKEKISKDGIENVETVETIFKDKLIDKIKASTNGYSINLEKPLMKMLK